jgi:hypothetical protein
MAKVSDQCVILFRLAFQQEEGRATWLGKTEIARQRLATRSFGQLARVSFPMIASKQQSADRSHQGFAPKMP